MARKAKKSHHGPSRISVWKGSISFGLLNIPVSLQSAETHEEIHFSMVDKKDFAPLHYVKTNARTGRQVPPERIAKAYEYEKGEYVIVDEEDLKKANTKATESLDIEEFVLLEEVNPLLFDKPYYVVPQKGAEKGYFLLKDALERSRTVAVGKIVLSTKQHLVLLMPIEEHIILEILRFPHEIKSVEDVDLPRTNIKFSSKEVKMAQELVASMTRRWNPSRYKDTYFDDLMERIKKKVQAGKGHEILQDETESIEIKPTENVVDLMPLLEKSIQAHKKRHSRTNKPARSSAWH